MDDLIGNMTTTLKSNGMSDNTDCLHGRCRLLILCICYS